jgi:predicted Zn-dependent protease
MDSKKSRSTRRGREPIADTQIAFFEGLLARDPNWVELLEALADAYTESGRAEDCVKIDERIQTLCPANAEVRINLAISLTMAGQLERALRELELALDLGYRDVRWLTRNPDLATLRKHPGYKRIRAKMRALATTC